MQQKNLTNIESKLKELKNGLDLHHNEVIKMRKQIETIQQHSASNQKENDAKIDEPPIDNLIENGEPNVLDEGTNVIACKFRTDIDPQTDIQVSR